MKTANMQADEAVRHEMWGFSVEHAAHLTRISIRQLRYWDETGFFVPTYGDDDRKRPYSRVYSFRDLASLRVIAVLRNKHKVPLQELRGVGSYIAGLPGSEWTTVTFFVSGRRVFFDDPRTGVRVSGRFLQPVLEIAMQPIVDELERASRRLRHRARGDVGKIIRHRYVMHNEPVLAGTRITTQSVWNLHMAGYKTHRIIREYPRLHPKDVRAAIAYEEAHRRKRVS